MDVYLYTLRKQRVGRCRALPETAVQGLKQEKLLFSRLLVYKYKELRFIFYKFI